MITPPAPLDGARELFALDPAVAYLNHGSFGAVPQPVRAARQRLIDEFDANPMRFTNDGLWERIGAARAALATFSGTDPGHSALVANATTGIALVLRTLGLRAGDEIVVTDHGYHAVALAVGDLRDRVGVRVVVAPIELTATPEQALAAVLGQVTERTRLVIVDQISSATAQLHPVAKIATALRERGVPLLVDGAHAPGMLPQAAAGIDADFWVGNLHKWGFAPSGTALLQVAPAWQDRIQPLVISHGYPDGFPANVEHQATRDYSPWLSAPVGLSIFDRYGETQVQEHNTAIAAYGQQVIGAALGLGPADLPDPGPLVSMRLIRLPEGIGGDFASAEALRRRISTELATEVPINVWRGRALLRVSGQIYNIADDYHRLAAGLPGLL